MVCNKVDEHKIQIAHIVKILFINANEMYLLDATCIGIAIIALKALNYTF